MAEEGCKLREDLFGKCSGSSQENVVQVFGHGFVYELYEPGACQNRCEVSEVVTHPAFFFVLDPIHKPFH